MTTVTNIQRRRFLGQSAIGLAAYASLPKFVAAMGDMQGFPKVTPNKANPQFKADVEFDLFCSLGSVSILPGQNTKVQHYSAQLKTGPKDTLIDIPGSYLGPLINLHQGQKVRINLYNQLPEPTVTHWHGLHVPANMDGHPQYAIMPGAVLVYEFEVLNRAGMNIYHPHAHEATATQVYNGLAGALFVRDAEETALELPSGAYELPIVIQDRRFDQQNQLVYARNRHDHMLGLYGEQILVNGHANYQIDVESRAYRLRVLNGSNARIYKLAWDDGTPLTVLGVDGGLLAQPEVKPYVMLAPGERLDVWADFSGRNVGSSLVLRSLAFSGVLPKMAERMGGMMMHANQLPVGSEFAIFTARVTKKVSDSPKLPSKLSTIATHSVSNTANPNKPLPIAISESPMAMLLNGKAYAFNEPLPTERIKLNSLQLMEIFHNHGAGGHGRGMGMMMAMAHPIHLHGQQFQIVSRTINANHTEDYATVRDGFIDTGLKDTVLVMPGETVRIIKPFEDFTGLFMYHCHNLEHEDMGMMREFLVYA